MKEFSFSNKLILRTPLRPIETDITWEKIQSTFSIPLYREALFVASPNLYNAYVAFEQDPDEISAEDLKSLKLSLYKYVSRLSNRCTPFGLFAYVSTVGLAKESNIPVAKGQIRKATKFDTFFLANLLSSIDKIPEVRNQLTYYPNSSLYTISDKIRYVEHYYKDDTRLHKISGVDANQYLNEIITLSRPGANLLSLVEHLVDETVGRESALSYLNTLIDNQFLVSELDINLTGDDYLERLIAIFSEERFQFFEGQEVLSLLLDIKTRLDAIETASAKVNDYLSLFEFIEERFSTIPITKLFQVDGYRQIDDATLSYKSLKQLRTAVQIINKLTAGLPASKLEQFKRKLAERYEENEVPLTHVLDPDIGINYAKTLGAKTPLVENLIVESKSGDNVMKWNKQRSLLFKKLISAFRKGEHAIELTEKEVNAFNEKENIYTDSFSIFFDAFNEKGEEKLYVKAIWGPSATCLVGRFAHLDESVYDLTKEIIEQEDKLHEDAIVAEIIHLPQARTGNVLHRKNIRSYEIPYLGQSSLPREQQIDVSDLMVSVKNGKITLRSKSLDKKVIPRLSNAHNFAADALPIYHFLCDLQEEGKSKMGFHWGDLYYEYPYLPRLSFRNIVLFRATWFIKLGQIKELLKNQRDEKHIQSFLAEHNIPNVVSLTKGDNEVVINFSNSLSRSVFYSMIKNKKYVELKEFLFQEEGVTGKYANEFIASAYRTEREKNKSIMAQLVQGDYTDPNVPSNFTIGDEWVYYKFYCGDKIAEDVLKKGILPIVSDLSQRKMIEKWFFLRYMDKDGFHIRFRFKLTDKALINDCIAAIKFHISPLEKVGLVWKVQIDTYQREMERYGAHSIDLTESIFSNDSTACVQFLTMIQGDAGERIRWLFSLLSMDRLLNDFGISLKEKVMVTNLLKTSFGNEFGRKGFLNKQINEQYNLEEKNIELFLDPDNHPEMYQPLWQLLEQRSRMNAPVVKELLVLDQEKKLPIAFVLGLIPSYLHMICNRVFLSRHRMHEMVVYDFLYKYYGKQLHTEKRHKSPVTEGQK